MLNPELAKEQLKTNFYAPNWLQLQQERIASLPETLKSIALDLLSTQEARHPRLGPTTTLKYEAVVKLNSLSSKDRVEIFHALYPKIWRYVEAAWQMHARLPYETGYTRKAFRAPNNPDATHNARVSWFMKLMNVMTGYEHDITWFAAWAAHLGWYAPDMLGILFAAAIDSRTSEGQAVFDILIASANSEHEIGAMGRHVPRALLAASRTDGWDFIERYLLAAQRQEGLRQVILEAIDETHPQAFRHMARLILDQGLVRFSATVRAVDVWFGFQLDVTHQRTIEKIIEKVLRFLDDTSAQQQALKDGSAEDAFLALWAIAFEDAFAAIEPATQLLSDPNPERRFAAAYLLAQTRLEPARLALLPLLDDPDLRVARLAVVTVPHTVPDLFERLERQLSRWPKKKQMQDAVIWPWMITPADPTEIADALVGCRGDRPWGRLTPYVSLMSPQRQIEIIETLKELKLWDESARDLFLTFVADPTHTIRERALAVVAEHTLTQGAAQRLEGLLTRKTSDLRRGVISILLNQIDAAAQESVERLLDASQPNQRLAGLEMARLLVAANRRAEPVRQMAVHYQSSRKKIDQAEADLIDAIINNTGAPATLDDGLGLFDPAQRTRPVSPQPHFKRELFITKPFITKAALACLRSLDALILEHKHDPVSYTSWQGPTEDVLGNMQYHFPHPDLRIPLEQDAARLILPDLWKTWEASRGPNLHDADGLELVRAWVATFRRATFGNQAVAWISKISERVNNSLPLLNHEGIVSTVLKWLIRFQNPAAADFLLDGAETTVALVPEDKLAEQPDPKDTGYYIRDWRNEHVFTNWLAAARVFQHLCPTHWSTAHDVRLWKIERWLDEPGAEIPRRRPALGEIMAAFKAGEATEADLLDKLIGARPTRSQYYHSNTFRDLYQLTSRTTSVHTAVVHNPFFYQPGNEFLEADVPFLRNLADRCRTRVLEVEIARGEMPTAASEPALSLRWTGGLSVLVRALRAMGDAKFVRGWTYDSLNKAAVFSHLVRATFPAEADTPEAFKAEVKTAGISQGRLIDLAVYAPQWAGHVEHVVGWNGFSEGVWWIHAHTKDQQWRVEQEVRDMWKAEVAERTPLTAADLQEGAVDVAWFNRIYAQLKSERWSELYESAEFASGGLGHARAKLFAAAMLDEITAIDLIARIKAKRHQDSVRALGLLPLPKGTKTEAEILRRYQAIQDFLSSGKKFGSQRRESEKLASRIAMDNLARTAGYPDPVRLQWAMEAKEIGDLAKGSITAKAGEVVVTLSINPLGEAEMTVVKRDKPLKAIPPAVKKDEAVAALLERKSMLEKQTSRMRRSLEEAMCLGQTFSGTDLRTLFTHPVVAVMASQLVFIGDGMLGYAADKGKGLMRPDGDIIPLRKNDLLRIAHPHDLWASKEWHLWQKECFIHERIQPFKQIFRELYVLTETERTDATISRRYAGHQVNPRQAVALLGSRGWVVRPDEGAGRTFHEEGITAYIAGLGHTFSPADVEGATLEGAVFYKRGAPLPMNLAEVPPRLFSEVMRDLDLVVSVARMGGVDPEASASIVELRAKLVTEACTLLKLKNVRIQKAQAIIEGQLGSYTVHLGSATVHRQPGGSLCIIPVHGQHRGRLFLPFVDDDPRTAEVLSKVILLAKDSEIKDPTILEQILK